MNLNILKIRFELITSYYLLVINMRFGLRKKIKIKFILVQDTNTQEGLVGRVTHHRLLFVELARTNYSYSITDRHH